jgi:hypothetical protein
MSDEQRTTAAEGEGSAPPGQGENQVSRRDLLATAGAAGLGALALGPATIQAQQPKAPPGDAATMAMRRGAQEQINIERTLGIALLNKLHGEEPDLVKIYQEHLRGGDPVVIEMLGGEVAQAFKRLPVKPGVEATHQAALSNRINAAAGKKNVALERNQLAHTPGQALHTLANLGGREFAQKYNLQR